MADSDLPRQELLIKLLRMTTSDNDGEALTALRKANAFLASAGWDWERLIHGKIRIIEDPFKNLGTPPSGRTTNGAGNTPARPAAPAAPQPPPFRPTPRQTWPLGIQPNRFAGFCYCCGNECVTNAGLIFKPSQYNSQASPQRVSVLRAAAVLLSLTYHKEQIHGIHSPNPFRTNHPDIVHDPLHHLEVYVVWLAGTGQRVYGCILPQVSCPRNTRQTHDRVHQARIRSTS